MSVNLYANFGSNIQGESLDSLHKGWVELSSYNDSITRPGGVITRGFSIVKYLDLASPALLQAACLGTVIPDVIFEEMTVGQQPYRIMKIDLKQVVISGVSQTGGGSGPTVETVTLTCSSITLTYARTNADLSHTDVTAGPF